MEEITDTHPVADHVPAVRLGARLREARLRMGLSVADVAAQIRLAPRQIEALEAEELQNLPELPFLRGFVRSYAKLLQIDAQPLLATLPDPHPVPARIEPISVDVPFNIKQLSKQQNKIWLVASAALLVVAIAFALWHFNTPKADKAGTVERSVVVESVVMLPEQVAAESFVAMAAEPDVAVSAVQAARIAVPVLKPATALAQSVVPASVVVAAPTLVVAPPIVPTAAIKTKLRIVFDGESWTEIKDASGKILSSQINAAGSELNLNGKAPYELVIGHAQAVHVYRSGKAVDLKSRTNATSEVARLTLE
jgi:cytoskeleton protein RodZ